MPTTDPSRPNCKFRRESVANWVILQADTTSGTAQLAAFNTTTGVQVGSTVACSLATGTSPSTIAIGNGGAGASSASAYFENQIIDYTNRVFPVGP
jgi:hypothetical protein